MISKSELRIAIVGGGIGGASAAVALQKQGFQPDVYEQATAIREVGAGIGLRPPTIRYFEKWGILEDIERVTTKSNYMEIFSDKVELLIKETWPALTDDPDEKWARLVHRADLLETLVSHIPSERLHLGHKCKAVRKYDDHAVIEFENGKKVEADLVIAADGIRSNIRSQFFSDKVPVNHKYQAYRAIVNEEDTFNLTAPDILRIFVDKAVNLYLLPLKHRNQVSVDLTVPSDDPAWNPVVEKEDMLKHLESFHPNLVKVVENIDNFDYKGLYDIDPVDTWSNNCITLIGDAAHSMLHNQGQGANMAIQDGGVLAEELAKSSTVAEALQNYEARQKPIAQKYQELSRIFFHDEAETAFPEKEFFEKA